MAKLPDTSQQRALPRFGGVEKAYVAPETGMKEVASAFSDIGDVMVKKKIESDKYRTEDADTKLQQKMLELKTEYSKVKSGDVGDDFYKNYQVKYDEAVKEIGGTLRNDDQKQMFGRRSEARKVSFSSGLIDHTTKEQDAYHKQVYVGGVAAESDIAASAYNNENIVKGALLRTQKLTEAESERLGLKGDVKKMLLKENKSNVHEAVIRNAIDGGDYSYAKTWFEKNQKEILGEKQDDIQKLLKAGGIKERSQKEVDQYILDGLNETEARAKARKLDPEVRDATLARIEARFGEADQIRDRQQKAHGENARNIYASAIDKDASPEDAYDSIPTSVLEGMDGAERMALQTKAKADAKGDKTANGGVDYYKLKLMAREDPKAFQKANPFAYNMSDADRKEIIKLQTDDIKRVVSASKTQIMSFGAAGIGLDPKEANKESGEGEKVRAFYKRVDDELAAYQSQTGKEPDAKSVQEIVDRLSIEVIRDPKAWFFEGKRPVAKAEVEGVPAEFIDEIAQRLTDMGEPVTDDNIRRGYAALIRQ